MLESSGSYDGEPLTGSNLGVQTQINKVLKSLIGSVEKRFADVQSGVLEATKLADLDTWPGSYSDAKGNNELDKKNSTDKRTHRNLAFLQIDRFFFSIQSY